MHPPGLLFEHDVHCCRYLAAQVEFEPQLYADDLECVSRGPGLLLRAAKFTAGYVRLVGQEPAPVSVPF